MKVVRYETNNDRNIGTKLKKKMKEETRKKGRKENEIMWGGDDVYLFKA